jgi:alkylation response protein AidB-like acyl-CoA dehydrogenase
MSDGAELIQRARDLAPMLDAAGDEIERRRELPEHVVAALIDGGFFRMLQPKFLGGVELRPVLFTQVTEALAQTMPPSGGASARTTAARRPRRIWTGRSPARSSARRLEFWPGVRRDRPIRRSRWMAAIASAASGASPAAAIMRGGWAAT